MVAKTLSHYRIEEKLGSGGMGEVYLARDEHLNREVAVKVLPSGALSDEQTRKRFRREAETLSKLNHPHIATVFDFDTQDGVDFLVMEYVPGETLKEKLGGGSLPEKDVTRLGLQIAEALEAAHEKGVIHRDLKPGNIALNERGDAKVLDFGIAKLLRSKEELAEAPTVDTLTKTAGMAGTLPYMSPEQLRQEEVDGRSDIYALGVVLYEMTTGQRPFDEKQNTAMTDAILHQPPPPPGRLKHDLSPRLEDLILKCLEKDPSNRYQAAKELAVDLRRLELPTAATPDSSSDTAVVAGLMQRHRGVFYAAVTALAAVLAIAGYGLYQMAKGETGSGGAIDSIAVLPFKNVGGDPDTEYLSDGVTESLIGKLSRLPNLKVMARSTVFRFKDSQVDPLEAGRQLGVSAVLAGRISQRGETLIIGAELVNVADGTQLWGEQYNRPMADIFAIQESIARDIARQLKLQLTPEEESALTKRGTENTEAYQLYLRSRFHADKWTAEGFEKAIEYARQAVEEDPAYAQAHARLAGSYVMSGFLRFQPIAEAYPKAKVAALKALEIDDTLAEPHLSLAIVQWFEWDWAEAEKGFERALELNPEKGRGHSAYGVFLVGLGRLARAREEADRGVELDPLSLIANHDRAWVAFNSGRYDDAIETWERALELNLEFRFARFLPAYAYSAKGMHEKAIEKYLAFLEHIAFDPSRSMGLAYLYAAAGRKEEARNILAARKGLDTKAPALAWIHGALGETNEAFRWLEKAFEERASVLLWIKTDPRFDPLRSDPRFGEIVRRMNLPE